MKLQPQVLTRFFTYNGLSFQDPGPSFTPEEVKDHNAVSYPELATAVIETEISDGAITYKFVRSVGTKG